MQSRTQPWNALTVLATVALAWIAGCAQPTAPASSSNAVAGTTSNSASNPAAMPSKDELKQRLSPLQFRVTQESGTERAFANEYWDNHQPGIYVDIVDGTPLFSSLDKFDSGTGWPSFTRPLEKTAVKEVRDMSHGMVRVEARSARADSHLGHVFDDGPEPTGQRYCMNSASMRFVPVDQLAAEGLGRFLPLFGQAEPASATPDSSQAKSDASRTTTETAMLAGGCFWGMEDLLRKIPGVLDTECGYTGGHLENPKYDDTHDSKSGHAEAVKIVFDPAKLKFEELLVWFFKMHDPTTLNRQGNDRGTQYRSAIFYADERQKEAARQALVAAEKKWKKSITTTLEPAGKWWPAEAYHQDYLQKNPGGYTCHFLRD